MTKELTKKQIDAAWESAPDRQGYARGRSRYDIAHAVIAADRAARIGEFPALPEPDIRRGGYPNLYREDQMRAYAAQAVEADRAARGVPDEMDAVAEKYAHKLALDLECVLADYSGKWWDAAIKTISEYRSAMNAIHERESPTFMGEPLL